MISTWETALDVNLSLDGSASYGFYRSARQNKPMIKKTREREMLHAMCSPGWEQHTTFTKT